MTDITMEDVNEELIKRMKYKDIQLWWVKPTEEFDGEMPMHVFRKDRQAVLEYARAGKDMNLE